VNGGKLIVNNTTGSGAGTGALTVNTGATLSGTGILSNTISVASGGTLAPGYPLLGTLTVNKAVTMQAGSTYETDVYANNNTSDLLATGANQITLNGTLKVVNQSGVNFAVGNSFKIFNATTITGNFASIVPATPGTGLSWDISLLKTNGVLKVSSSLGVNTIMKDSEINIFPNPVKNSFTIDLPNELLGATIELYNSLGIKLMTIKTSKEQVVVDIKNFSAGIYVVKLSKEGFSFSERIIKE
jgi:hypothetical protein